LTGAISLRMGGTLSAGAVELLTSNGVSGSLERKNGGSLRIFGYPLMRIGAPGPMLEPL